MRGVRAGTVYVLLVNVGGTYYALDNVCPHAGYSLHKGRLDDHVVTCILHGAEFDVRTGEHISDPKLCENDRTYPVEVRDGAVYITLPDRTKGGHPMTGDTITKDMTVNDVIGQFPKTIGVFNRFNVDSCCGGARTLEAVSREDGADLRDLLSELIKAAG